MKYRTLGDVDASETAFVEEFLEERGWKATTGDDWHLLWSFGVPDHRFYQNLKDSQRLNHFPGAYTLSNKDELAYFLDRAGGAGVHPRTFSMPDDHETWLDIARAEPETVWIRKRKRLSGGIDAIVFTEPATIELDPRFVVQEYVANPLLLPGNPYKHVLRLYVVITRLDPLTAYVHTNGPVKITSRAFSITPEALSDPIVHLTNPYVQRHNNQVADPVRSIDLHQYFGMIRGAGYDTDELWARLRKIVKTTLLAHQEPILRVSRYVCRRLENCFELLGFDILVDADLRPWVLECNVSPALGVRGAPGSIHQTAQRRAKQPMVADTLTLVLDGEPGGFETL